MPRWFAAERLAPIIAGIAGLAWFWAELAPQRAGFPDTDDPALGLQFINAHPVAWPLAGLALGIASIALIGTVLALRARLGPAPGPGERPTVGVDAVSVVGIIAAAMLAGMAAVRMSGGPVRYVQGLDQAWGESAYLVTQLVGIQALVTGGFVLLELWIVGVAWLGVRRRVLPRAVALLAVVPAFRLISLLGPFGIEVEGLWPLLILAVPATFAWLVVLGVAIRSNHPTATDRLAASPAAGDGGRGLLEEAPA